MKKRIIVITGNVVNGLQFWGPFDTADDLYDWVYHSGLDDAEWTSALLEEAEMPMLPHPNSVPLF